MKIITIIFFLLVVVLLIVFKIQTKMYGGRISCNNLHFIKQGNDTCWIDAGMYALIVPDESYKLMKDTLHLNPEMWAYAKRIRKNKFAHLNRCTPGGGYPDVFLTDMIKSLNLNYKEITNFNRIGTHIDNHYPDYLLYVTDKIKTIAPNQVRGHKLVAMLFNVHQRRANIGHVTTAVLCGSDHWKYYDNNKNKVLDIGNNHISAVKRIESMLKGKVVIDYILYMYCRV